MLTLHFKKKNKNVEALLERFKEMALGYEIKIEKDLKKIQLTEGDELVVGNKAIHKYLDKLQGELKQWWYCDC